MTLQEQIEFLGLEKLNVLDTLNLFLLNFQITGSISLFEYGVIKRKILDLDIVVNSFDCLQKFEDKTKIILDYSFDYTDEIEQKQDFHPKKLDGHLKYLVPNRAFCKINEIDVCFFVDKNQEHKYCKYMLDRKFKVSHPRYAIEAKRQYLLDLIEIEKEKPLTDFQKAKRIKHSSDILAFENTLWLS